MPIEVTCPECDKELRLKDELAGKKVKCPGCAEVLAVPSGEKPSWLKHGASGGAFFRASSAAHRAGWRVRNRGGASRSGGGGCATATPARAQRSRWSGER